MDPLEVLPPEVSLRVLELLEPTELCRCLAVSHRWRQLADSEKLWRRFCRRRQLLHNTTQGDGVLPLCSWASTYIGYMRRLIGNWRSGAFESYQLVKEDWFCCIACFNYLVAVYYPRTAQVRVYSLDSGLEEVSSVPVALSRGIAIPDVFVSERHLVLSRGNSVLVYEAAGGFRLRKAILGTAEGGLLLADRVADPLAEPSERRLYVKIVADDVVWLESDSIFVVDMATDTYRTLGNSFRCLRYSNGRVFAANEVISVFSLTGEKLFALDVRCVADMWVSDDTCAVLIEGDEQRLELWSVSRRSRLAALPVIRDPAVCLGRDRLYSLEFGEGLQRVRAVSLEDGVIAWERVEPCGRELGVHPELRLLAERFLFVRPTYSSDLNFLLLDSSDGEVLYDSVMPPSLTPPSYIYHLSDQLLITAESSLIHFRRYV